MIYKIIIYSLLEPKVYYFQYKFNNLINNNQMKKKMYIAGLIGLLIAIHSLCNDYLMMGFTYIIVSLIFIIIGEYKLNKEKA